MLILSTELFVFEHKYALFRSDYLKKKFFIVLHKVLYVGSSLFEHGIPFRFKKALLFFRSAGIFGIKLAVCLKGAPIRSFVPAALKACPCGY